MNQSIFINGVAVVTRDENNRAVNVQFLPDDELSHVLEEGSRNRGTMQVLRNGSFDYVANKVPARTRSTLLCKAAHGRISATADGAYQLTLKIFKREGLDVRATMEKETYELLRNVKL